MPIDPWTKVNTRHGFFADEVISALQKEIRRSNTENAAILAYEMFTTSEALEEMLWQRLQVISVEDIGWGDLQAPILINALYEMRSRQKGLLERGVFAIHAVRFLSSRVKDRSSDEMYAWLRASVEENGLLPDIPDYALDKHTKRGSEMGRDREHFYNVSSKVIPELKGRETEYLKRLRSILNLEAE